MTRPDDSSPPDVRSSAYDAFWTASEADLDIPLPGSAQTASPATDDTYAAFRQAADE